MMLLLTIILQSNPSTSSYKYKNSLTVDNNSTIANHSMLPPRSHSGTTSIPSSLNSEFSSRRLNAASASLMSWSLFHGLDNRGVNPGNVEIDQPEVQNDRVERIQDVLSPP